MPQSTVSDLPTSTCDFSSDPQHRLKWSSGEPSPRGGGPGPGAERAPTQTAPDVETPSTEGAAGRGSGGGSGCCRPQQAPADGQHPWERAPQEGAAVPDLCFVVYTLGRKNKEFARYRDLLIYVVFLAVFTVTLLSGKGLGDGYHTTSGVASVFSGGPFDQGPGTGLYFERTFFDIGSSDDFWQWVLSQQTMLSAYGQVNQTIQGQTKVLPIIRYTLRRVRAQDPDDCSDANEYLHGNWTGWAPCFPQYSRDSEDRAPVSPKGGGPVDVCGRDRMNRTGFEWSRVQQVWPGHNSDSIDVLGKYFTYPPHGYYFDTYADMSAAAFTKVMRCYRTNGWLDARATRSVQVLFFTYNPATNLFLEIRFLLEITRAGLFEPQVRLNIFRMFRPQGFLAACELTLGVGIAYYAFKLLHEIYSNIVRTRRLFLWAFSVWRLVEIFNLAIFFYVGIMKLFYYWLPVLELRFHAERSHYSIRNHEDLGQYGSDLFDDAVHARLEDYSFHMRKVVLFSAFNGCLSYLKLFKYLSLSPHFNLLTETIKTSMGSLISLLLYLFIITNAFAIMGLIIFGTQLEQYATYTGCLRALFISLLGDFDYDAMLNVNHDYVDVFFFGYQILAWLILINMVISIISEGFQRAKTRQTNAVGQVPLAAMLRESWAWLEDHFLGLLKGRGGASDGARKDAQVASPIRWNALLGVSTGDLALTLQPWTARPLWLDAHREACGGAEVRRAADGSWGEQGDFEAEDWEAAGWERQNGAPCAVRCSGAEIIYPETARAALAYMLRTSTRRCAVTVSDAALADGIAGALCWYFQPCNMSRGTIYQAWVFYNEIEVPRMQYADVQGVLPHQQRYLEETGVQIASIASDCGSPRHRCHGADSASGEGGCAAPFRALPLAAPAAGTPGATPVATLRCSSEPPAAPAPSSEELERLLQDLELQNRQLAELLAAPPPPQRAPAVAAAPAADPPARPAAPAPTAASPSSEASSSTVSTAAPSPGGGGAAEPPAVRSRPPYGAQFDDASSVTTSDTSGYGATELDMVSAKGPVRFCPPGAESPLSSSRASARYRR